MNNVSMIDGRIVYGARCSWWDSISKVGRRVNLPCCPHCGNVLFEMPSEADWWAGVDHYEAAGHPGYRRMMEWARGKCFQNFATMQAAFAKAEGRADG